MEALIITLLTLISAFALHVIYLLIKRRARRERMRLKVIHSFFRKSDVAPGKDVVNYYLANYELYDWTPPIKANRPSAKNQ
jgi:hypothetical protein